MAKGNKAPALDESLLRAFELIDNQIARAMQRTPSEREASGVQKWRPFEERVEKLSTLLLENYGEKVGLDSVLVMSQVMMKVLTILSEELGEDGLGKMRSMYIQDALRTIEIELERAKSVFKEEGEMLM